jgi:hypothetical protein
VLARMGFFRVLMRRVQRSACLALRGVRWAGFGRVLPPVAYLCPPRWQAFFGMDEKNSRFRHHPLWATPMARYGHTGVQHQVSRRRFSRPGSKCTGSHNAALAELPRLQGSDCGLTSTSASRRL